MPTITAKDVVDAAIKNGYKHARGAWFREKNKKIVSACFMGQAALNLSVGVDDVASAFSFLETTDEALRRNPKVARHLGSRQAGRLHRAIMILNDETRISYRAISKFVQDCYETQPKPTQTREAISINYETVSVKDAG